MFLKGLLNKAVNTDSVAFKKKKNIRIICWFYLKVMLLLRKKWLDGCSATSAAGREYEIEEDDETTRGRGEWGGEGKKMKENCSKGKRHFIPIPLGRRRELKITVNEDFNLCIWNPRLLKLLSNYQFPFWKIRPNHYFVNRMLSTTSSRIRIPRKICELMSSAIYFGWNDFLPIKSSVSV